ncbi:MAG: hypothetical protein AAFW84_12060 [Cyanobacteria bacterium J06635_15]
MHYPTKFFQPRWIVNGLVAIGAIALPTVAIAKDSTPIQTPVCFMQTETGQIINLTHLCGSSNEPSESSATARPQPQILPTQNIGRGAAQTQ